MIRRSVVRLGVAIAALGSLAGCGNNTAESDVCAQYADLVKAHDQMAQQPPLTAKAEDVRAASDDFSAELDQFQAVSEGRLDTAISTLRADIDAVRQAVDARGESLEEARPRLRDSMDDVSQAWASLQDLVTNECDDA